MKQKIERMKIKVLAVILWMIVERKNLRWILTKTYEIGASGITGALLSVKETADAILRDNFLYSRLSCDERTKIVDVWWMNGKFHR